MRIIAISTLKTFWEKHPDTEQPLKEWYIKTSRAQWESLADYNWTQKEMAGLLGMTAARLNAILSGKANPTYEQARTISQRLDIDPAIVLAI